MPPKGKGTAAPAAANASTSKDQDEQEVVAVLLADPFDAAVHFGSLIQGNNENDFAESSSALREDELPYCLFPVLNTPLLAYSLDALQAANVDKIYIYLRHGLEAVKTYLAQHTMQSGASIILKSTLSHSQGDIMQEVDALQLKTDFLLLRVGYVGNLDLAQALSRFAEKRSKDPHLIMDCLVAQASPSAAASLNAIHVLKPDNGMLHYESGPTYPKKKRLRIPREVLENEAGSQIMIRTDLVPVGVEVCSPDVPPLFTENFDYESIRPHFINGILTSDLLGKAISCSIIGETSTTDRIREWASFVQDTKSLVLTSQALIARKCYPIAPDEHIPGQAITKTRRHQLRGNKVYVGQNVDLARTSTVSKSLIGHQSTIASGSTVTSCSLGSAAKIAENCTIINSHISDNVDIGAGCVIRDCVIGSNVRIGKEARLSGNCLLGEGVVLGDKAELEGVVLSTEEWQGEKPDDWQADSLPKESNAHVWPSALAILQMEDDDTDARNVHLTQLGQSAAPPSPASSISSLSRSSSSSSLASAASTSASEPPPVLNLASLNDQEEFGAEPAFAVEARASLARALDEEHTVDNAAIELKTLRMASNVSLGEVRDVVVHFLCMRFEKGCAPDVAMKERAKGMSALVGRWGPLLEALGQMGEEEMVGSILSLQKWCSEDESRVRRFPLWLKVFYEEDVVDGDAVIEWWKVSGTEAAGGEPGKKARELAMPLVKALAEDSSEEESD